MNIVLVVLNLGAATMSAQAGNYYIAAGNVLCAVLFLYLARKEGDL